MLFNNLGFVFTLSYVVFLAKFVFLGVFEGRIKTTMKETSEENLPKEAVGEDWCFICYEGGDLRICDYE